VQLLPAEIGTAQTTALTLADTKIAGIVSRVEKLPSRKLIPAPIADKLDLPSDEVEDLIKGRPRDDLAYLRSRLEPQCPGCHQTICIDTPKTNILGKAWHAECSRKAMFGPYAA